MDGVKISEILGAGETAALVTVVDTKGSAPRHPGASMLVAPGKAPVGTVGGGKGESAAIELAKKSVELKRSFFLEFEMLGDDAEGQDLICGGINRMLVEYVDIGLYRLAAIEVGAGRRVAVVKEFSAAGGKEDGVTPVTLSASLRDEAGKPLAAAQLKSVAAPSGEGLGKASLPEGSPAKACATGKPSFAELDASWAFADPVIPDEKLLVLGGGHVGRALIEASSRLGFSITLVDDRPALAAEGRFGPSVRTIIGDYVPAIDAFPFDSSTYAVIVTRGHLFDLECARAVLKRPLRYAGLIGSSRKVKMIREKLAEEGLPASTIASLHSPIGLPIAAETPDEIAVSILAEIIAVRRGASK